MKRLLPLLLVLAAACGDDGTTSNPPEVGELTLTTAEDTAVTKTLPITDASLLSIELGTPAHGTITHAGASVTYTPAENYNGTDSVTVTVSNGTDEVRKTLAITVTPVNDAPVAVDDSLAADRNETLVAQTSMLLANDTDVDGDTLTVTAVAAASTGTVALAGDTVTYTPPAGFAGTATFDYTISDGTLEATATVTVTVTGDNVAPVAVDDTATTAEDTPLALTSATLVANDTDADGQTLSVTSVGSPTNGTVVLAGGTATFTPTANYNGAASFTYVVTDGTLTDTGTVNITVTPVNDAPVANDDVATTPRNTALVLPAATLLVNDTDVEGTALTISAVSGAVNGTVALAGTTVTFTPTTDYVGAASFVYTVTDGTLTDTATVVVNVTDTPNVAPVAVDDTATTAEDTAKTFSSDDLTANDTDADDDTLMVTAVSGATNGTVALAGGTVTFTPTANYNGAASFVYTVSDGTATDTATVTITVTPVNDAPVAVDDTATTVQDTAVEITATSLLANDTDVDGDTLSVTAVGTATNGTVALAGTTITFTPTAGFAGTATFEYTVSDGALTDTGLVTVTITAAASNTLVEFTFTGATGSEATRTAETVAAGLAPVTISRAGVNGATGANAFTSTNWPTGTVGMMIDTTKYVTFTLTPSAGNAITMTQLAFSLRRSGSGPQAWAVRTSVDGYAANLQAGMLTDADTFVPFSAPLGAAFASLTTPVTFRIYGWSASAAGGSLRQDDVKVTGSVTPTP